MLLLAIANVVIHNDIARFISKYLLLVKRLGVALTIPKKFSKNSNAIVILLSYFGNVISYLYISLAEKIRG